MLGALYLIFFYGPKSFSTNYGFDLKYAQEVYGLKNSNSSLPMIILLHGAGADEKDLLPLMKSFSHQSALDLRVISFRGPFKKGHGYDWANSISEQHFQTSMQEVASGLAASIIKLVDKYPPQGLPILIGFSRGAELALFLGAKYSQQFSSVISLGGYLRGFEMSQILEISDQTKFLMLHGEQDLIMDYRKAKNTELYFKEKAASIEFLSYPAKHQISQSMQRDLARKLNEIIASF